MSCESKDLVAKVFHTDSYSCVLLTSPRSCLQACFVMNMVGMGLSAPFMLLLQREWENGAAQRETGIVYEKETKHGYIVSLLVKHEQQLFIWRDSQQAINSIIRFSSSGFFSLPFKKELDPIQSFLK